MDVISDWPTYRAHAACKLETGGVVKDQTSGSSATYECSAANLGKLHQISSTVAIRILGGTGSSVDATAGRLIPAGIPRAFRFGAGLSSLGFKTLTGSWSATDPCVIELLE